MLRRYNLNQFREEYVQPPTWQEFVKEIEQVKEIIGVVRKDGDQALYKYTSYFDGVDLDRLTVSAEEMDEAASKLEPELKQVIDEAHHNIEQFHNRQQHQSFWFASDGALLGQVYRPLQKVGAYIPGGTAAYPSTVLMTLVPAQVAGVSDICLTTPPGPDGLVNPVTLFAARQAGVKKVYKLGGAQAVAAMAYGTESVDPVEKIVGPGNIYVTLAKKEVYGDVGIDLLAGPSEIMVVAGDDSNASFIAADLLSQAEHDPSSQAYLVTPSEELAGEVEKELETQLPGLDRRDIAERAIEKNGGIIVTNNLKEAWEVVNLVAPEHLELHLDYPWSYLDQIKSAGSIFLGAYSPEALGDYWAGPNHVLPTGRAARFASPLGVEDFMKYSQVISYSPEALRDSASRIEKLARVEGLEGHARSIQFRREK